MRNRQFRTQSRLAGSRPPDRVPAHPHRTVAYGQSRCGRTGDACCQLLARDPRVQTQFPQTFRDSCPCLVRAGRWRSRSRWHAAAGGGRTLLGPRRRRSAGGRDATTLGPSVQVVGHGAGPGRPPVAREPGVVRPGLAPERHFHRRRTPPRPGQVGRTRTYRYGSPDRRPLPRARRDPGVARATDHGGRPLGNDGPSVPPDARPGAPAAPGYAPPPGDPTTDAPCDGAGWAEAARHRSSTGARSRWPAPSPAPSAPDPHAPAPAGSLHDGKLDPLPPRWDVRPVGARWGRCSSGARRAMAPATATSSPTPGACGAVSQLSTCQYDLGRPRDWWDT